VNFVDEGFERCAEVLGELCGKGFVERNGLYQIKNVNEILVTANFGQTDGELASDEISQSDDFYTFDGADVLGRATERIVFDHVDGEITNDMLAAIGVPEDTCGFEEFVSAPAISRVNIDIRGVTTATVKDDGDAANNRAVGGIGHLAGLCDDLIQAGRAATRGGMTIDTLWTFLCHDEGESICDQTPAIAGCLEAAGAASTLP